MKLITRKRFVRAFLSSILASEMTEKELMEIISEFPYDPELNLEIRQGLNSILGVLSTTHVPAEEHTQFSFNDPLESAYAKVKKRRLSKENLLETIRLVIGSKGLRTYSGSNTVREMLDRFFSVSTQSEQELFLELLDYGKSKDDAFLQGIIRNK
jgi:hypothetical protein